MQVSVYVLQVYVYIRSRRTLALVKTQALGCSKEDVSQEDQHGCELMTLKWRQERPERHSDDGRRFK